MKIQTRIGIVVTLLLAVGAVLWLKAQQKAAPTPAIPTAATASATQGSLPRLVDLGANSCVPCKMMAPVLEELRAEYAGKMQVEFIDVWKDPDAGSKYLIQKIPTQIFIDASGKELFRHEGYFSKEDILAQWELLGVSFDKKPAP